MILQHGIECLPIYLVLFWIPSHLRKHIHVKFIKLETSVQQRHTASWCQKKPRENGRVWFWRLSRIITQIRLSSGNFVILHNNIVNSKEHESYIPQTSLTYDQVGVQQCLSNHKNLRVPPVTSGLCLCSGSHRQDC